MQPLIGLDQLINTCIRLPGDGWGMADETISARAFRCHLQGFIGDGLYRAIGRLFFWQPNHCEIAYRNMIDRNGLPQEYKGQGYG